MASSNPSRDLFFGGLVRITTLGCGLNGGSPKDISTSLSLETVNVTIFRKRVYADVTKVRTLR